MKKEKKLNESSDDTFNEDYKEILNFEDSRPDPLKKEKFPIQERLDEVINYVFDK